MDNQRILELLALEYTGRLDEPVYYVLGEVQKKIDKNLKLIKQASSEIKQLKKDLLFLESLDNKAVSND